MKNLVLEEAAEVSGGVGHVGCASGAGLGGTGGFLAGGQVSQSNGQGFNTGSIAGGFVGAIVGCLVGAVLGPTQGGAAGTAAGGWVGNNVSNSSSNNSPNNNSNSNPGSCGPASGASLSWGGGLQIYDGTYMQNQGWRLSSF